MSRSSRAVRAAALSAVALAVAVTAPPAGAHGALSETYTVSAATPLPAQSPKGRCSTGVEDVHKDSHGFQVPRAGVLTVQLDNFTGDWDLEVVDTATGAVIAFADGLADEPVETVTPALAAGQAVDIVACNYAGGPTARVGFTFQPSKKRLVSVGDAAVAEGDDGIRKAFFAVTLSKPATTSVTVAYATADATAKSPDDYTGKSGTLQFKPGQTSITLGVRVGGETAQEPDERFTIALSSPGAGAQIGRGTGTATIVNDDPFTGTGSRLAVGDVAVVEGNTGTRLAAFTVSLSRPSVSTVTVSYATANGTATKPADYLKTSGTLSFAPGKTAAMVTVPVVGEGALEGDETFTLNLSTPTGATIADGTGVGTIIDDI